MIFHNAGHGIAYHLRHLHSEVIGGLEQYRFVGHTSRANEAQWLSVVVVLRDIALKEEHECRVYEIIYIRIIKVLGKE